MTRPRKATVDWFPHSTKHGKTIFTLEKLYGIAGYGFWFKLLEILGDSEGHFIDTNNAATLAYLEAYTYTDSENCKKILDLLAVLDAIDPDLWAKGLIWSDNFIKGITPAYRKREDKIPKKPDNGKLKTVLAGFPASEIREGEGRRTKENEGKGREGEKDFVVPGASAPGPPAKSFFSCKYFVVDFDYRMKIAREWPALQDERLLLEFSKMEDWIGDHPQKLTFRANGHLANPKLFIRNWLNKIEGIKVGGGRKPKGFDALEEYAQRGQ